MNTSDASSPGGLDSAALVGTEVAGRYVLTRLVVDGANTLIFDGDDLETGRRVTIKVIHPDLGADPSFVEQLDHVMRPVSAMSHPNIAAVFDWGRADIGGHSTSFIVLEELTGGSLRDMFDRRRQLSPSQALMVGLDACRGLDYAHRRGLVHTEMTPSKLLFGDDRRLRIVDFGLARLLGERVWKEPDSVPNHVAAYSAPEQGLGEEPTPATDVYALCLMLHEAVTGTLPFREESTVATLGARVGRLMPVSADLGPLATVLERAGRPDADERPSAAEFGKSLVGAAAKLPRPEPLPLLSSGLFDTPTERLRSPDDPTGGVTRPAAATQPIVVVPLDTPDDSPAETPADEQEAAAPIDDDADVEPAVVVTAAAAAATESPAEPAAAPADTAAAPTELVITPLDADPEPVIPTRTVAPTATMTAVPAAAPAAPIAPAEPIDDDGPRRVPAWAIIGVALLVFAAGAAILFGQMLRTPVHTVPSLAEMPEAEALNLVAPYGWDITVTSERNDDVPTAGLVIRSSPGAGLELAEGQPLLIVISDGPVLRAIPESVGLPLDQVQTLMADAKLAVTGQEAYDEDVPAGVVISWTAPSDPTLVVGSLVEPGTPIELVVSAGPEPRTVPDVVGSTFDEAERVLKDMRLEITETGREFSDDYALDEVISQTPDNGTEVERGATVEVVVSKGPDVVPFPDLSGSANYAEAELVLRQAGFVPTLVLGDSQSPIQSATIDGAAAVAGQDYRRGSAVEVVAVELRPPTSQP